MPPCAIDFTRRFTAQVRDLSRDERGELDAVLQRLSKEFGQPHSHQGLGIRRLRGPYFECRLGRSTRAVFELDGSMLIMVMLGNHDEVRKFLRGV